MEKPTPNQYPIHELLKKRWSTRAFSSQPVERGKIFSLFEAARWSPSGGNLQPWAFIVAEQADQTAHVKFVETLNGRNALWAKNAPVLVLAVAKRERQEGQPNFWALYDLGQAVANLTVQARAMGLSVRQMGGFDREKARGLFEIPPGYEPVTVMAVGYHGSAENLPEDLQNREMETRSRKPLSDFVFIGRWDEPIEAALETVAK